MITAKIFINALLISTFLHAKKNQIVTGVREYYDFTRKVRYIFNRLEGKKFIVLKDPSAKKKPEFLLNTSYEEKKNLYLWNQSS